MRICESIKNSNPFIFSKCFRSRSFSSVVSVSIILTLIFFLIHILSNNILVYKKYLDYFSVTYNSGALLKTMTAVSESTRLDLRVDPSYDIGLD